MESKGPWVFFPGSCEDLGRGQGLGAPLSHSRLLAFSFFSFMASRIMIEHVEVLKETATTVKIIDGAEIKRISNQPVQTRQTFPRMKTEFSQFSFEINIEGQFYDFLVDPLKK